VVADLRKGVKKANKITDFSIGNNNRPFHLFFFYPHATANDVRAVTIADRRIGGSAADRRFADRRSCNEYYRSPVAIVRLEYFSLFLSHASSGELGSIKIFKLE
jgi:hypothetical protein